MELEIYEWYALIYSYRCWKACGPMMIWISVCRRKRDRNAQYIPTLTMSETFSAVVAIAYESLS